MELFHAAGLLYEPGQIIEPGNWGRVVLGAGPQHPAYYRELWFDDVRAAVAQEKPSRFGAFFGCRTEIEIARFLGEGTGPHVYRVEVSDEAPWCEGDLLAFYRLHQVRDAASTREIIAGYWTGDASDYTEVIVHGRATVLEQIAVQPAHQP